MKNKYVLLACAVAVLVAGCATTSEKAEVTSSGPGGQFATRYKATDGRTVEIGHSSPMDNGLAFKNPHMDKCWLAQGFNFGGYDTLYISPTFSTAKLHNNEEQQPHELAKQGFSVQLEQVLRERGVFPNIVLRQADIKPGGASSEWRIPAETPLLRAS